MRDDTEGRTIPRGEPRADFATTIVTTVGLVLSLPFAISCSLAMVLGLIGQYKMAAGLIEHPWQSAWAGWTELSGMFAALALFFAVPGAILAIMGFVKRRTPLAWITLVVVAVPWFLTALYIAVASVVEAR
jgi:hypothetical protein